MPTPTRSSILATTFGALLLLGLLFPHAIEDWVGGFDPNDATTAVLRALAPVSALSDRTGLPALHDRLRDRVMDVLQRTGFAAPDGTPTP